MNTFEGAYYTNLSYRPELNFFAFYSLACQDFPLDKIIRIEGVDGRNYETKEDAINDLSETYPEMERLHHCKWMGIGDVCVVAMWKKSLTQIYNDLSDTGIALYVIDDKLVRNLFWFFDELISHFNGRVDIVQLFSWENEDYPALPKVETTVHHNLYEGVVTCGDAGLLLSKAGIQNILDVYREHPDYFPETLFYHYREQFKNLYTVKKAYEWIGHRFIAKADSDREKLN